jgi:hypothetical protein
MCRGGARSALRACRTRCSYDCRSLLWRHRRRPPRCWPGERLGLRTIQVGAKSRQRFGIERLQRDRRQLLRGIQRQNRQLLGSLVVPSLHAQRFARRCKLTGRRRTDVLAPFMSAGQYPRLAYNRRKGRSRSRTRARCAQRVSQLVIIQVVAVRLVLARRLTNRPRPERRVRHSGRLRHPRGGSSTGT